MDCNLLDLRADSGVRIELGRLIRHTSAGNRNLFKGRIEIAASVDDAGASVVRASNFDSASNLIYQADERKVMDDNLVLPSTAHLTRLL